jgi:hypothetical protein
VQFCGGGFMKKDKFFYEFVSPESFRSKDFFSNSLFEGFFVFFNKGVLQLDRFVRGRNFVFSAFLLSLFFGFAFHPVLIVSFVLFLFLSWEWCKFYLIKKDFEENGVF